MLHFLFAIMDIGSTGTRINIFGFTKEKDLVHYKKYEVRGGLHNMDLNDIKNNISSLVGQIPDYVDKIPMGVYCTAGFRHPLNLKKLFYIKKLLDRFNIREYGILSGKYEGYLGYISLSYILNTTDFILIDMGGKSTQVVAKDIYKSYNIGYTNIGDITKKNIIRDKIFNTDLPIYISSGFTRKKRVNINFIKNEDMRNFLIRLGVKKELHGIKVNWTLGMSLRFLYNEI